MLLILLSAISAFSWLFGRAMTRVWLKMIFTIAGAIALILLIMTLKLGYDATRIFSMHLEDQILILKDGLTIVIMLGSLILMTWLIWPRRQTAPANK